MERSDDLSRSLVESGIDRVGSRHHRRALRRGLALGRWSECVSRTEAHLPLIAGCSRMWEGIDEVNPIQVSSRASHFQSAFPTSRTHAENSSAPEMCVAGSARPSAQAFPPVRSTSPPYPPPPTATATVRAPEAVRPVHEPSAAAQWRDAACLSRRHRQTRDPDFLVDPSIGLLHRSVQTTPTVRTPCFNFVDRLHLEHRTAVDEHDFRNFVSFRERSRNSPR